MNYKEVIWKELALWRKAYPKEKKLLKKFAEKLKLEIELQTDLNDTPLIKKETLEWIEEQLEMFIQDYNNNPNELVRIRKVVRECLGWEVDGVSQSKAVPFSDDKSKPKGI